MLSTFSSIRLPAFFTLALGALILAGCQEQEQIRTYQARREEIPKKPAPKPKIGDGKSPLRLVGTILPSGNKVWFIKTEGIESWVKPHVADIEKFVDSVEFPKAGEKPIKWTVPEGWREGKSEQKLRYATFLLGPEDKQIELVVTPLGGDAGDPLANVNRWRGIIGLPDIDDEEEFHKVARPVGPKANRGWLVDMTNNMANPGK